MSENVDESGGNTIEFKTEIKDLSALMGSLKKMTGTNEQIIRGLDKIMSPLTALQKSGDSTGLSKISAIGEVQVQLQRQMVLRLAQIQMNTASKYQRDLAAKQAKIMNEMKNATKAVSGGGGAEGNGMGAALKKMFSSFGGMLKGMFRGLQNVWNKTAGALFKKTGAMGINKLLGLGGATIIGALVGKMISSSPLLQAMFKIMNTSLTLILRPIGDFFGAFLRPMSIYFLKEVAIPFFQQNKKMMAMGEQWGKAALGFFINPGKAVQSAIILAFKEIPFFGNLMSERSVAEAKFFQQDPGGYKRWSDGITKDGKFAVAPWGEISPAYFDKDKNPDGPGEYEDTYPYPTATVEPGDFKSGDFWTWLREQFDNFFNPIPEAAADTGDGLDDMGDSLDDWGNAWDDFTTSIDDGAKDWGRQISRWADEQGKAFGEWTAQVGEDTKSWFEGASEWIANGWEWITNFGKVNEAFADTGKESEEAQGSLLDGFWSWVESIKVAIFGTQVATDAFNDTIITAGDKINTAADIATGHIFSGGAGVNKPGRDPAGDQVGGEAAGQAWDPLTGLLNLATGENHPPGTVLGGAFGPPSDSTALYGTPKPDDVGHSNLLGEYSDTKFESSPGKFVDIYSGGTKVDPNSEEGKRIQSIYQAQHDAKIANAAQQATMAEVKKEVTTADAGKAYILAGGGEEGLSAVEYAKEHGLDMAKYADIVQMADALGLEGHPMIKTAKEGLAAKIAMAETIMQDRIDAGQTPSIQGDMLELFPNVEDSEFGWSDKKLEEFKKDNENRYISMYDALTKSGTAITKTTYSDPSTGGSGYVGGINVAPWLSGGDIGTTAHTLGPNEQYVMDPTSEPTPEPGGGGGIIKPGGKGGHSWGDFGPGIGGTITVINPSGGPSGGGGGGSGANFGGQHGGSWSGGGFRAANQWGGIIDEPIVGIGQHTGKPWRLGESQHELVTPMSEVGKDGNIYSINIHVGSITKEADYEKLKPLIQRWILEASSRRGMV